MTSQLLNSYDLSRTWFDFCFANPEKVKPNHTALYFFIIEQCNRLGWKLKFGLPSGMAMEAIGIKSYNTYSTTLSDLVDWGFILMIEKSKNQYSSNIVAISKFDKALVKALDKALIKHDTKHTTKQSESTVQSTGESIDSIDKQVNKEQLNNKPLNKEQGALVLPYNSEPFLKAWEVLLKEKKWKKKSFAALQTALDLLSKSPEVDAIQMIKKTIAGEWQGIFELKEHEKYGYTKTGQSNSQARKTVADERKSSVDAMEAVADEILRRAEANNGNGGNPEQLPPDNPHRLTG